MRTWTPTWQTASWRWRALDAAALTWALHSPAESPQGARLSLDVYRLRTLLTMFPQASQGQRSRRRPPDLTNADLGVVSFKFSNTPASPQAANQVRGARQASLPAPGLRRGARIGARCGSSA